MNRKGATLASMLLILAAVAARAQVLQPPYQCAPGPSLAGGVSDPSTVNAGAALAYTVYSVDQDLPQIGGPAVLDKSQWNSDHVIESIPLHAVFVQGDDPATGKRTYNVSGNAATPSGMGQDVLYYDQFWFDDNPSQPNPDYIWGDDPGVGPYTKVVTIKTPPAP